MNPAWVAFGVLAFAAWTQRPRDEQPPTPKQPPPPHPEPGLPALPPQELEFGYGASWGNPGGETRHNRPEPYVMSAFTPMEPPESFAEETPPRRTPRRRRRRHATSGPLLLPGPVAPPPEKNKQKLANLMTQPLPQALEAARLRFLKGPVTRIEAGRNELVFTVDPHSTALLMVPPSYLGWPVRLEES